MYYFFHNMRSEFIRRYIMHPIYVLFFLQYVERILNYKTKLKMQK